MKNLLSGLILCIFTAYPILIYTGLNFFKPRYIAAILVTVLVIRLLLDKKKRKIISGITYILLIILALFICIMYTNNKDMFLFMPLIINTGLLVIFLQSLFFQPSIIEQFARLQHEYLSKKEISYCYRITIIWSIFFLFNGSISLYTALFSSFKIWTFYNGLLSYILFGILFISEITFRYWRFRRYGGAFTDVFFRHIFPPEKSHET